jgi:DNA-binding NtrC family response regulator
MFRNLPEASAFAGQTNPVVLSVSSNDADHASIRGAVAELGYRVVTASTCGGAAQWLRDPRVSVVICDSNVPDGTWRDVLNSLSGGEGKPAIIVTSRHADDRLWAEVLNVGGFDVLAKPFDADELRHVLETACLRTIVVRS